MTTYAELRASAEAQQSLNRYSWMAPKHVLALLDDLDAAQAAVRDLASAVEHSRRCLIGDTSVGLRHAPAIAAAREGAPDLLDDAYHE